MFHFCIHLFFSHLHIFYFKDELILISINHLKTIHFQLEPCICIAVQFETFKYYLHQVIQNVSQNEDNIQAYYLFTFLYNNDITSCIVWFK